MKLITLLYPSIQEKRNPILYKFPIILLLLFVSVTNLFAKALPFGTWNYTIYHDENKVGTAKIRRSLQSQKILTTSEISFLLEETFTVSNEKIIESGNFKPLQYITESTFVTRDSVKRISMDAQIHDDHLVVSDGNRELKFSITRQIHFGTNIILASLLKTGLEKENSGQINMYDPSVSPTKTVPTYMECFDNEPVQCQNHSTNLHKVTVKTKDKILYTMYCDDSGVVHKYVMTIQNKTLTLTLSAYDS